MLDLSNHCLIAMPTLNSDVFEKSVVYIAEHSANTGTIGIIINKPIGKTAKYAFSGLDLANYSPGWLNSHLYFGGPVNSDNGFILHRNLNGTNTQQLQLSGDREILDQIALSSYKDDWFIAAGYSAWAQQQLEWEISKNYWLVVEATPDLIFTTAPYERYASALKLLGVDNLSCLYNGKAIKT